MSRLFLWQRATALVLAPLVLGHLIVIIWAVQDGLSATEILTRTRSHVGWMIYYGLFVLSATVHGTIGLRSVVREWTPWQGPSLDFALVLWAIVLGSLGLRAVAAVTLA